jgi:hypothetical protein
LGEGGAEVASDHRVYDIVSADAHAAGCAAATSASEDELTGAVGALDQVVILAGGGFGGRAHEDVGVCGGDGGLAGAGEEGGDLAADGDDEV